MTNKFATFAPWLALVLLVLPAGALAQDHSDPDAQRRVKQPFGDGPELPGRNVTRGWAWLPISTVPYSAPDAMKHEVAGEDLVIGLARGDRALAYPIKMLGGPQREIVNEELAGEPIAVNW